MPFCRLIQTLLERDGFWVRPSFKVELTKSDKLSIGHLTCPRWEIDILAYRAATNELWFVECKSKLDSWGIRFCDFTKQSSNGYRFFTDANLRKVVTNRVVAQLEEQGACIPAPATTICLAAGKIRNEADRHNLRDHFKQNGWVLLDEEWISKALREVSKSSYEDDVARVVVTFLLKRRHVSGRN
jgi:hypothetical protein